MHPDVFTKRLKDAQVDAIGLREAITWKDLRAFAATELARHEEGVHVAQAVLRHKSLITTLKYYASVRTSDLQKATKNHGKRLIDYSVAADEPPWWEDEKDDSQSVS
jgi:integrase